MTNTRAKPSLYIRPDRQMEVVAADSTSVARALSVWERLAGNRSFSQALIVLFLAIVWEAYGRFLADPLLFPPLSAVITALYDALVHGPLLARTATTLGVLLMGYAIGIVAAGVLTCLAVSNRVAADLLSTLTAMFNPLPAIALLPLALLWFGLGTPSLLFVIVHSVLWSVALSTFTGFSTVSPILKMAGQNFGLRGLRYIAGILIPAAFPSILVGLKIGWAFAWRTLIAAELVFGVSSRSGGLGWFIFENRNNLRTENVFAGLLTVIAIGLLVERVLFRSIEERTIRRWGMTSA